MPEERRPDGPRQKCNAEGRKRSQCGRCRVGRGEEKPGKYQYGCSGVDVEVEKLDRRSHQAGKKNLPRRIYWFPGRGGVIVGRAVPGPILQGKFCPGKYCAHPISACAVRARREKARLW